MSLALMFLEVRPLDDEVEGILCMLQRQHLAGFAFPSHIIDRHSVANNCLNTRQSNRRVAQLVTKMNPLQLQDDHPIFTTNADHVRFMEAYSLSRLHTC